MTSKKAGFSNLKFDGRHKIYIDGGSILYACAHKNSLSYEAGDYIPAVKSFLGLLLCLRSVHKWYPIIVFDGRPPPEKADEHQRRTGPSNTSLYIGMCAHVCRRHFFEYVVSPLEADVQIGRRFHDPSSTVVVFTGDSDLITYGHKIVIVVESWFRETYRYFDLRVPVTEETRLQYPLYDYYHKYGVKVFYWWSAVMGCDVSLGGRKTGITHAGSAVFLSSLKTFADSGDVPNVSTFAEALHCQSSTRVTDAYSVEDICDELRRVSDWFGSAGRFYDKEANVWSIRGDVIESSIRDTYRHMIGELDPKTGAAYSAEDQEKLNNLEPHNLLHDTSTDKATQNKSLPPGRNSVKECTNNELKLILISKGASISKNGKGFSKTDLEIYAQGHLLVDDENESHTVHFNRSRENNGSFAVIDTSSRKSIPQIINALITANAHEEAIMDFFRDIQLLLTADKFEHDFNAIAIGSPHMKEDFVLKCYSHIGQKDDQRAIELSRHQVMEMDEVVYHGYCWAEDGDSIYILSKQKASMKHDEAKPDSTREKPEFNDYLVMVQIATNATTYELHGHDLGECAHIMRSYCAYCKAGCGMCRHRAALLWMQHLHWSEHRPMAIERPPTSDFCSWIPGSQCSKRAASVNEPAKKCFRISLPSTNDEARKKLEVGRQRSCQKGVPAEYQLHKSKSKMAKFKSSTYTSQERFSRLYKALRDAQLKDKQSG